MQLRRSIVINAIDSKRESEDLVQGPWKEGSGKEGRKELLGSPAPFLSPPRETNWTIMAEVERDSAFNDGSVAVGCFNRVSSIRRRPFMQDGHGGGDKLSTSRAGISWVARRLAYSVEYKVLARVQI